MNLKLPLFNLLFWAAMGLFVLGTYSCSEPASPFGQTEITLTTKVPPSNEMPYFVSQLKATRNVTI